jgi:hypothetical protein
MSSQTIPVVDPTAVLTPVSETKRKPKRKPWNDFQQSDAGNAELIEHLFGDQLRFDRAITAPIATARALLGATAGSYAAGHAGRYLAGDVGEQVGKIGGGLVGGALGAAGRSLPGRGDLLDFLTGKSSAEAPVPLTQSPSADAYAAIRAAQRAQLRTQAAGAGTPGSAVQEAGWQPNVTRVPIRPEPSSPLTPESVPGPDSSGRGNLLTPLAKQGDSRAAQELL